MKNHLIIFLVLCSFISQAQQVIIDSVAYKESYRKVRIFLPEHYQKSELPLLVMLDAQNLFDKNTSYAGEWNVDETIASFPLAQQAIVIAIDHGNELRMEELTPVENEKYGGGKAADFLQWIMQTALPQSIKKNELHVNFNKVAIAGSSLGGLFAHYAALQHPDYFQTAGVFSPSFWWSEETYHYVGAIEKTKSQNFYFAAGTDESKTMIPEMIKMNELMLHKGFNARFKIEEGAAHNEAQWRASFPLFYSYWIETTK